MFRCLGGGGGGHCLLDYVRLALGLVVYLTGSGNRQTIIIQERHMANTAGFTVALLYISFFKLIHCLLAVPKPCVFR